MRTTLYKAILAALLAVMSSGAMAEWVLIRGDADGNVFTDSATIRRADNKVKMWRLIDYKTAQDFGFDDIQYMSLMIQDEYDCKEEQLRKLYSAAYSENMGRGKVVVSSNKLGEWVPTPPGSIGAELLKFACGSGR